MTPIDQTYLRDDQYRDASNLNARIALHRRFGTNKHPFSRWEFDHYLDPAAGLPTDARLLELGCGPATLWRDNLDRLPDGWSVTLTDLSPGMLAEAQQNLGEAASRFDFQEVDAQSLPFDDATFDAVIANHMLYHVPNRAQALGEIARVLKPGGRLFAATNGTHHLNLLVAWRKKFAEEETRKWSEMGRANFTLENGGEQLSSHFSQVKISPYDNTLVVDEVEPLVAYVQSIAASMRTPESTATLRAFIKREMKSRGGVIRIENATGMFVAVR